MNHGFKLHPDGTLEITMPKGVKVGRVLVKEEMSQNGALYYRDGGVPDTNVGDIISRQTAIDLWDKYHPYIATKAMEYDRELRALPSAEPERWSTCFDCPLSHGCPVINGCTNEQAMQYAGEIPDDCPVNKISAEPEWKKGNWIKNIERFGDNAYHCSQCGAVLEKDDLEWRNNYYCYHCGSKMER